MSKNTNLSLVSAKGALKAKIGSNLLFKDIINQIQSFGDINDLKNDKTLLEHICKLVENADSVKLEGKDKRDLVIKILIHLFPVLNNEQDIKNIGNDIDYLCSKDIVKQVSIVTKVSNCLYQSILKKE